MAPVHPLVLSRCRNTQSGVVRRESETSTISRLVDVNDESCGLRHHALADDTENAPPGEHRGAGYLTKVAVAVAITPI